MTSEEIVAVLAQFHRDVIVPDMDQRMEGRDARLEATLRREIAQLRMDLPGLITQSVKPDLDDLEERLGARFDHVRDETLSHFDSVYKRFDTLETEYHSLTVAVGRLEGGHRDLSAAVRRLEERSGSA